MNPLTNVKNITKLNEIELARGHTNKSSWHNMYKDSAWLFIGGLSYGLTEGDILAVFSQYGEIVNLNLVRDKKTGKTKGFCFICYANQKSTILAVDNLNGIKLCGRTLRVDHVENYRPPKENEEDDDITKMLQEQGCAPKPIKQEPSDDDDVMPAVIDNPNDKKKNKSKKKKHKKHSKRDTSSESEAEVKVKQEKLDSDSESTRHRKSRITEDRNPTLLRLKHSSSKRPDHTKGKNQSHLQEKSRSEKKHTKESTRDNQMAELNSHRNDHSNQHLTLKRRHNSGDECNTYSKKDNNKGKDHDRRRNNVEDSKYRDRHSNVKRTRKDTSDDSSSSNDGNCRDKDFNRARGDQRRFKYREENLNRKHSKSQTSDDSSGSNNVKYSKAHHQPNPRDAPNSENVKHRDKDPVRVDADGSKHRNHSHKKHSRKETSDESSSDDRKYRLKAVKHLEREHKHITAKYGESSRSYKGDSHKSHRRH